MTSITNRMRQIVNELFSKMHIPLPEVNTTERAIMNAYFEKYNSKFEVQRALLKDLERNSQSGVFTLRFVSTTVTIITHYFPLILLACIKITLLKTKRLLFLCQQTTHPS